MHGDVFRETTRLASDRVDHSDHQVKENDYAVGMNC